jgi:hypothetical protein
MNKDKKQWWFLKQHPFSGDLPCDGNSLALLGEVLNKMWLVV